MHGVRLDGLLPHERAFVTTQMFYLLHDELRSKFVETAHQNGCKKLAMMEKAAKIDEHDNILIIKNSHRALQKVQRWAPSYLMVDTKMTFSVFSDHEAELTTFIGSEEFIRDLLGPDIDRWNSDFQDYFLKGWRDDEGVVSPILWYASANDWVNLTS